MQYYNLLNIQVLYILFYHTQIECVNALLVQKEKFKFISTSGKP